MTALSMKPGNKLLIFLNVLQIFVQLARANHWSIQETDICGDDTDTAYRGYLASPNFPGNYNNNHDCTKTVRPDRVGKRVSITFEAFELENHADCRYDNLTIIYQQSPSHTRETYGTWCGTDSPPNFGYHGLVEFRFRTDGSSQHPGFRIHWDLVTDICDNGGVNGHNGNLVSPNYPGNYDNNHDCSKTLAVPYGKKIKLRFTKFSLESHSDCSYDRLIITIGSSTYGRFCGNSIPSTITADEDVTIRFTSDSSSEHPGFRVDWEIVTDICEDYEVNGDSGYLTSPNFPENHNNRHDCFKVLSPPYGKRLKVNFLSLELETHSTCNFDSLTVFVGNRRHGKFCGRGTPASFTTDEVVTITFTTDGSNVHQGFHIYWEIVGTTDICGLDELSGYSGYLTSTNFPGRYENNRHCLATLTPPPGKQIELIFLDFGMEYESNCRKDNLTITSGSSTIGTFCGGYRNMPENFVTDQPVGIRFRTDGGDTNEPGFRLHWKFLADTCGVEVINENSGYVTSSNFPANYEHNHFCYKIISPPHGKRVLINFLTFELENNCDFDNLTISIGSTRYGPFCGINTPPEFSRYEDITIAFRSDGSVSRQGFRMRYRIIDDICENYELTGESGYLSSPNFPGNYSDNIDCSKTISPPVGKRVEISFLTVEIEDEFDCLYDQLLLTVGVEKYSGADFCGNRVPRDFTTDQNVTIRLQTDESVSLRGLQIYWAIVDDCDGNSFRCWDGSCISLRQKCDGNTNCRDQSDEIECAHTSSRYGECGKNSAPAAFTWNAKIVGGSQARQKSFPWIVPLFDQENFFFCSASIISERWLLTAAHCTETSAPSDLFGLLGTNDISDFSSTRINFDQVVNHPNYTEFEYLDIALLHTTQPIVFNDQISPICIPDQHDSVDVGEICVAIGWGDLYFNSSKGVPDFLRQVRLPLVDNAVCRTSYPNITDAHVCAGDFDKGGTGTCQGDSGGPLVCFRDGSWLQFGVTSYGNGCADPQYPSVFTDVRSYYSWIQENLSPLTTASSEIDICGDYEILGHSGDLITPNYPGNYINNLDCTKTLSPPHGQQFRISFVKFKLENSTDCVYDNLTIHVGNEAYGTFCRNDTPATIITGKNVTMRFRSDYIAATQGFHIHWEVVTDCGYTNTIGDSGYVTSPNFPRNINSLCYTTLSPPNGKQIKITFLTFDVDMSSPDCDYNSLTITNGNETYGKFCGIKTPPNFTTGEDVRMVFRSIGSVNRKGFQLYWEVVGSTDICGHNTRIGSNGYLTSPNFPGNYESHHICSKTLMPPPGKPIEVIFVTFELENQTNCDFDSLVITIGNETYGGSSFCGSNTPRNFITYDDVTISFVTDGHVHHRGFRIYWEINADVCSGDDSDEQSGFITSPNYPENSHDNVYCFKTLSPPSGKRIIFSFDVLELENDGDCRKNNLTIIVGGSEYEGSPFCGTETPRDISTTKHVTIAFTTDASSSHNSTFFIRWEIVYDSLTTISETTTPYEDSLTTIGETTTPYEDSFTTISETTTPYEDSITPVPETTTTPTIDSLTTISETTTPYEDSLTTISETTIPYENSITPVPETTTTPTIDSLTTIGETTTPYEDSLTTIGETTTPYEDSLTTISETTTPNENSITPVPETTTTPTMGTSLKSFLDLITNGNPFAELFSFWWDSAHSATAGSSITKRN